MAKELSLLEFAGLATELVVEVEAAKYEALKAGAEIIEKEAKRVIGTYDYGWPQLAPSTQQTREREGFPANEPLLRTGDMRDSIEHTIVSHKEAVIGSDSDVAVYQELGTATIPARSFLAQAAVHSEKEVGKALGKAVVKTMLGEQVLAQMLLGE